MTRTYDLSMTPTSQEEKDRVGTSFASVTAFISINTPNSIDLRANCPPIYDQGQLGACTGFSSAKGLLEYVLKQANRHIPLSALFAYYNGRSASHEIQQDAGARIVDVISGLLHEGCSPEVNDPYDTTRFTVPPSKEAFEAAKEYKALTAHHLWTVADMEICLASGYPFVIGIPVYAGPKGLESQQAATTGQVDNPDPGDALLGGHAITVVGYDRIQQKFLVRNSWGPNWGDHGYFWLPYAYIIFHGTDAWTVRV